MTHSTFIQDSRIGRTIFQISGDHLEISGRDLGRKFECRIALRSLDEAYERRSHRFYLLILIPLAFVLICAGAIRIILHQEVFPHEAIMWPGLFLCLSLWTAIRGTPPVEFYEFRNHFGKVAFIVVRERKQSMECDAFVSDLVLRIKMAANEIPPAGIEFPPHLNSPIPGIGQNRWKASLVMGLLAAGLPLVPGYDFTALPIIFLLCTGGFALGIFSFLAKEPRRWLSVLGMALSMIPPLFY